MKALLCLAVVAALALAGCGAKPSDSSTSASGSKTSTGSAAKNGTASVGHGDFAANRAPTIGAFTTNRTVGGATSVPIAVPLVFRINATDADKDNLTFTLVWGDKTTNGTGKLDKVGTGNKTHAYAAAGNYTVKLIVSDGKLTANKTLLVAAVASATAGSAVTAVFSETQEFPSNPVNSLMTPGGYAGGTGCVGYWAGFSGQDCVFFELEAAYAGHLFTATADVGDPDLEFWPTCSPSEVFAVTGFAADGPEAGTIPAGALCVVIWDKEGIFEFPTHTFTVI